MATQTKTKDPQFIRTRQMATFVPVVAVPFCAFMFWLLGGGQASAETGTALAPEGLNTEIPAAEESKMFSSKLEAYSTPIDSSRNSGLVNGEVDVDNGAGGLAMGVGVNGQPTGPIAAADQQTAMAQQQLLELQRSQIAANQAAAYGSADGGSSGGSGGSGTDEARAAREFQQQMQQMRLQHEQEVEMTKLQMEAEARREIALKKAERESQREEQRALLERNNPAKPETNAYVEKSDAVVTRLGFSDSGKARFNNVTNRPSDKTPANMLPAVIHESQEVVSGALVKLRLTKDCTVNGRNIPANSFIYATAGLSGERLTLSIETMKSGGDIFPVALQVYDLDGLEGLHIPGAITRDAAKQAGASGVSSVGSDLMMVNPSLTAQAAGVAIETAKQLGSQKIRLVKVRLKSGYKLLLKRDDEKN